MFLVSTCFIPAFFGHNPKQKKKTHVWDQIHASLEDIVELKGNKAPVDIAGPSAFKARWAVQLTSEITTEVKLTFDGLLLLMGNKVTEVVLFLFSDLGGRVFVSTCFFVGNRGSETLETSIANATKMVGLGHTTDLAVISAPSRNNEVLVAGVRFGACRRCH